MSLRLSVEGCHLCVFRQLFTNSHVYVFIRLYNDVTYGGDAGTRHAGPRDARCSRAGLLGSDMYIYIYIHIQI